MIINTIFNFTITIITMVTSFVNLPNIPDSFLNSFRSFLNLIGNNLSLLGLVFRPSTFKQFCVLSIILINFDHMYEFAIYVYHKVFNRA